MVFNETIVYKNKDAAKLEQEASKKPFKLEEISDEYPPREVIDDLANVSDEAK